MSDSSQRPHDDVALLCGPTEDRQGAKILRARAGKIEAGEIRPVREGQPLSGEVVRLRPRTESPAVCDVDVLVEASTPSQSVDGPAQVATETYRNNWDRIFGRSPEQNPPGTLMN